MDGPRVIETVEFGEGETMEASVLALGSHALVAVGDIYIVDATDPSSPVIQHRELILA